MILHFADKRFQHLYTIRFLTSICLYFLLVVFSAQVIDAEEIQNTDHSRWLHGFRVGILAHDVPLWSRTRSEGGFDLNAEVIFNVPDISLFTGKIYSNVGFSLNNQGDTNTLYSGLLWEYNRHSGLFLNFGLGLAVHDGELQSGYDDKKALGSRVLFRIPVELGLIFAKHHGVSVLFVHVSNAYLAEPNEGLDTIGLRYSYRF
jgi:hypothetical protein